MSFRKWGEKLDKPDDALAQTMRTGKTNGRTKPPIPAGRQAKEIYSTTETGCGKNETDGKIPEGMQNSMEMEIDMANLESLRQIIHGLIKLSFDQESLMKDFTTVQLSDPRYVVLSQTSAEDKGRL